MNLFYKFCGALAFLSLGVFLSGLFLSDPVHWQPAAVTGAVATTLAMGGSSFWKGYQFTAWIITSFVAGMIYPQAFDHWGSFDVRNATLSLFVIQLVMFGMGTQMSLRDFAGVLKSPYGVIIGMSCQYTIMPLVGWSLTKVFTFHPEVAAGIILIGSCSSGLASNVMTYIAKSNVALSITMTAVATLMAPIMTPLWMKILAGELVAIDFTKMMMEIINMVIIPILAALIDDYKRTGGPAAHRIVWRGAILGALWLFLSQFVLRVQWPSLDTGVRIALDGADGIAISFVVGLAYHSLRCAVPAIHSWMPFASMAGIVYVILLTTVKGRDNLLLIGPLLFIAASIHNGLGYLLGYTFSRLAGLDRNSARTIAFEVGLQNGGMAAGLAANMGKMGTVGLAAAIFAPWMNISGSILANYWGSRPVIGKESTNSQ